MKQLFEAGNGVGMFVKSSCGRTPVLGKITDIKACDLAYEVHVNVCQEVTGSFRVISPNVTLYNERLVEILPIEKAVLRNVTTFELVPERWVRTEPPE